MRVLYAQDLRRTPWKNGGGETMEIAVYPADAKLDDFEWRVSMALVDVGGAFSQFPEIDRTITILDGGPLGLSIDHAPELMLTATSDPVLFPGDVSTSAVLHGARVTDLNVMTRRDRFRHRVTSIEIRGHVKVLEGFAPFFILVRSGEISVPCADDVARLGPGDGVLFDDGKKSQIEIEASSGAVVLLVEIFAAQ